MIKSEVNKKQERLSKSLKNSITDVTNKDKYETTNHFLFEKELGANNKGISIKDYKLELDYSTKLVELFTWEDNSVIVVTGMTKAK